MILDALAARIVACVVLAIVLQFGSAWLLTRSQWEGLDAVLPPLCGARRFPACSLFSRGRPRGYCAHGTAGFGNDLDLECRAFTDR